MALIAHGERYESVEAARARVTELEALNAQYGPSDGRVTEIDLIEEAIKANAPEAESVYVVEKQEYTVECDHPACATMHRRLHNGRYEDGPRQEWVENLVTGEQKAVWVSTYHMKKRTEWVILRNGQRVGDAHATKREAWAEVNRFHPTV